MKHDGGKGLKKLGKNEEACVSGHVTNSMPKDWGSEMRAAVVDFLFGVQVRFGLRTEMVLLAVNVLDRFLI